MGLTYIASGTASGSPATISFTSGIDATYNEYQFHFVNIHPADDNVQLGFQVNASNDTGGGFDTSLITSTAFHGYHNEADDSANIFYQPDFDLQQQALYQTIGLALGNADKESVSGVLTLYAPSSTTYVKHFTSVANAHMYHDYTSNFFSAGYINTALAIPEIRFKMSSGNIQAGTIHMYGVG
jgi:hypothetical protein